MPTSGAVRTVLDAVASSLRRLHPAGRVVVAFSGGADSTVLLDAVARCWPKERISAWHVHHGLQRQADEWSVHCEREAARHGVHFGVTHLGAPPPRGTNVEAWARERRYRALWDAVAQTRAEALLTAHHADDQLETVLMRLARGSGPAALAGMSAAQQHAGGWLLRPLLSIGRERIVDCAHERGLSWIDDPMNDDASFVRVALRTRVIPEWKKTVPSLRENVLRSAEWLGQSGEALREFAARDLREAGVTPTAREIDRRALAALPAGRRDRAVRAWFEALGAPMPDRARLAQWVWQMLLADSPHAKIVHGRWCFRRYRHQVSVERACAAADSPPREAGLSRSVAPSLSSAASSGVPAFAFRWRGEGEIALPGWGGVLRFAASTRADSLAAEWLAAQSLEVRSARHTQRLRPDARGRSRSLKNLFQERGIAPYLRSCLPALHAGERLLYVAGIGMDRSEATAAANDARIEIDWLADDADDPRAAFCDRVAPV